MQAATTPTATPSAASAVRRPALRQTYVVAIGSTTTGYSFAAIAAPSSANPSRGRPTATAARPPTVSAAGHRSNRDSTTGPSASGASPASSVPNASRAVLAPRRASRNPTTADAAAPQ